MLCRLPVNLSTIEFPNVGDLVRQRRCLLLDTSLAKLTASIFRKNEIKAKPCCATATHSRNTREKGFVVHTSYLHPKIKLSSENGAEERPTGSKNQQMYLLTIDTEYISLSNHYQRHCRSVRSSSVIFPLTLPRIHQTEHLQSLESHYRKESLVDPIPFWHSP